MPPAFLTIFIVKNRYGVGGLTVQQQLANRIQAGFLAGRTLNRVNTPNQIQRINN